MVELAWAGKVLARNMDKNKRITPVEINTHLLILSLHDLPTLVALLYFEMHIL
jgi:hypothetical protein